VIRKLEEGVHPELEVGRFLTGEAGFAATPAMLGWTELDGVAAAGAVTLSILQAYVPNAGDGWSWVLDRLARAEGRGEATEWLRRLGRRTAEMHRAFATDTPDPASGRSRCGRRTARPGSRRRRRWRAARWMGSRRHGTGWGRRRGRWRRRLLARRGALEEGLRAALAGVPEFAKARHHGDYHLGQVLVADGDAVIVDFEGEPLRPLEERRAKHAALRDVAGMLRSLAYAAAAAGRAVPEGGRASAQGRLSAWEGGGLARLPGRLHGAARGGAFLPADRAAAERVLRFFMLEKALYEVAYELANRPDWVGIPLGGVLALLDGMPLPPRRAFTACPSAPRSRRTGAFASGSGRRRTRRSAWSWTAPSRCRCVRRRGLARAGDGPGARGHALTASSSRTGCACPTRPPPPARGRARAERGGRPRRACLARYGLARPPLGRGGGLRTAHRRLHARRARSAPPSASSTTSSRSVSPPSRSCRFRISRAAELGLRRVLPYAPDASYGRPEDLKALVEAAHSAD
jgi:predicted trehalose synthase